MFFRNKYPSINATYILCLIRDGKASSYSDLIRYFSKLGISNTSETALRQMIVVHTRRLIDAGLIKANGRELEPTSLITKIQSALDISLTDLSKAGPNATLLSPIFGQPELSGVSPDVFVLMPFAEELQPVYED